MDGQHRLGALLLMAEQGLWDREEKNVVIEVFETRDEEEIGHLFAEINRYSSVGPRRKHNLKRNLEHSARF